MRKLVFLAVLAVLLMPMATMALNTAHTDEYECASCHTVHNSVSWTASLPPLWGRGDPNLDPNHQGYNMYSVSGTQGAADASPSGFSRLCLGCHDGTTEAAVTGNNDLGKDLRDMHPVSFVYDSAPADFKAAPAGYLDGDSKVQCTSCHDLHNATYAKNLRADNSSSGLCLACHTK